MVFGAICAALVLGRPRGTTLPPVRTSSARWGLRETIGLAVTLCGVVAYGYATFRLYDDWARTFDTAGPLMLAGVAIWSIGLSLLDRGLRNESPGRRIAPLETFLFMGVIALAVFMRFYRLDYFPPSDGFVAIEEPQSGMGAWLIMAKHVRPWEFLMDRWIPVPFFELFGTTITALRLPFIIVSCLTVVAVYLLARELVNPWAAIFTTGLFAVARWHLNYARLAHACFPTTLIVVIIWWLCVRQMKRGGLAQYPWIGFLTAYTLYAYAGYRATGLVVGAFLATRFVVALRDWWGTEGESRRVGARRRVLAQTLGLVITGAALAGPCTILIAHLRSNPLYFVEAYNRSYQNKEYYTDDWASWIQLRLERQVDTARIFNHRGDGEQAYNLPGEPMLDPVTGVLFAVGLFYCMWNWRFRLQGYFAYTFLFLLIAGATLTQTLVVCRLQGVVPLIFVLIGFAGERFGQVFVERFGPRGKPMLAIVAIALFGASFYFNYEAYFGRTISSPIVRAVYRNFYTAGTEYYHSLPSNAYFALVSDMHNFFEENDYAWWIGKRVPGAVTADLLPFLRGDAGAWHGRETHIVIQRPFEQSELMSLIRDFYPDAECNVLHHPEPLPHLDQAICILRSSTPSKTLNGGVHARYYRDDEVIPFLERDEPAISWAMVPDACEVWSNHNAFKCRVEWEGSFVSPASEGFEVDMEGREVEYSMWIDGERLGHPVHLNPGRHTFKATAEYLDTTKIGARVQYRTQASPNWKLLRFDAPLE